MTRAKRYLHGRLSRLSPLERSALNLYLQGVTFPLLVVDSEGLGYLRGSGTLLRLGDDVLLVTAAHVVCEREGELLRVHAWVLIPSLSVIFFG